RHAADADQVRRRDTADAEQGADGGATHRAGAARRARLGRRADGRGVRGRRIRGVLSDRSMPDPERPHRSHVSAALIISAQSALWTIASSSVAVWLGIHSHIAVLVAFGAIGFVDAIGSIALVYHFRHGLRHDALSEKLEGLAHRVVLVGLLLVGCAAIVGGVARLASDESSGSSGAGVVL